MDASTLLLLLVVAVVAASQVLQYSGRWILKPWIFWPVEALLAGLLLYVIIAPFDDLDPAVRPALKGFLILFVLWRTVHNYMLRTRVRARSDEMERVKRTWKGKVDEASDDTGAVAGED